MHTLVQSIRVGVIALARSLSHTNTCAHICTHKLINPQAEMRSPWWYRTLFLIDAGWSHPLNNSGATDVSGREMSLISSAILGLKHHSHDETMYLGHGSPASSTQKMF